MTEQVLNKQQPTIHLSAEFFPPRDTEGEALLWKSVNAIASLKPRFLTVTYGAGGSTQDKTLETAVKIQEHTGIPTATHLTCVGAKKRDVIARLDTLWDAGIKHIVALRGDPPKGGAYPPLDDPDYFHYANELVAAIKAHNPAFEISVAAYPECHPQAACADTDMKNLKNKLDHGADRAITQFFFEKGCFQTFVKRARDFGIQNELVAGIMAVNNFAGTKRFSLNCGTNIPAWLDEAFAKTEGNQTAHDDYAIALMQAQISELLDSGVSHFHMYSMNHVNPTMAAFKNLGF
jgi:methylenetetrahydrofolate reductase (NADPH)